VKLLQQGVVSSYENNLPLHTTGDKRKVPCMKPTAGEVWPGNKKTNE
jgi:hypothetical protein